MALTCRVEEPSTASQADLVGTAKYPIFDHLEPIVLEILSVQYLGAAMKTIVERSILLIIVVIAAIPIGLRERYQQSKSNND